VRPTREPIRQADQTYFVTFQTVKRTPFFRNERWAVALFDTIQKYSNQYSLHDFVIMPDHVHLLLSPLCPLEKAVQLIKGGYSFTAKRSFNWKGDIWQPGFSDHRIRDIADLQQYIAYIEKNVASLQTPNYKFCGGAGSVQLAAFPQWLKPLTSASLDGGAEAPPLQS
jgi:putative transposase